MKRRLIGILLCAVMTMSMLTGCGGNEAPETDTKEADATGAADEADESEGEGAKAEDADEEAELTTIKLGVRADFIDFVEAIRESVKEAGYELDVTTFDDSIQPNVALGEGSIDVNWFQHQPYLDSYNAENGTDFVMAQP